MKVTLRPIAVLLLAGAAAPGWAQGYPNKPVRILVGYAPGGGTDIMARAIGAKLTDTLKQQFVIENRPGANANIAAKVAADAPADGYTILFMSVAHIMSKPVYKNLGYDIERDFVPITVVTNVPNVLCLHPSLPVKNVKELIALAKAKPGTLNYASGGRGAPTHLAAELFKSMAGVDIVHIPYKGSGPALISLIGGHEQLMFTVAVGGLVHVKAGRLKLLAVTSAQPSALLPGLPTVAASGLPGYESVSIQGLFTPVKTPAAVVQRLQQEVARVVARAEVKEKFFNAGTEVVGSSPAELAAAVQADITAMAKVIKAAGIRAD